MTENLLASIENNYNRVLKNIENSARKVGRDAGTVKLLVVTKGQPIETVRTVVVAGACYLGENYVEDAVPKIDALVDKNLEWHMIGHVQSRKARAVSSHFSWVHSIDRLKLARRLDHFCEEHEHVMKVLLECNVSQEASKFGWPAWDEFRWPELVNEIFPIIELPNLEVRGLMTMPPYDPEPEKSRPYFEKLRRLSDYLAGQFPQINFSELSMGMSGDYQVAVEEGATIVRVGTAIVGQRTYRRRI